MSEMLEIQINTDGNLVSFHLVPDYLRGGEGQPNLCKEYSLSQSFKSEDALITK